MLENLRKNALLGLNFGENARIFSEICALDDLACECEFGDVVRIIGAKDEKISDEIRKKVRQIALDLRPWRKGPFEILGTFIDSEWQSFMKFNLLVPHLNLDGKIVADVGCNNGYYMFKFGAMGAKKLVGFDPSLRTYLQFLFLNKFIKSDIVYELLGVETLGEYEHKFDTIFCLGVLYHRSDPIKTLKTLKSALNRGGEVFIDTMFIDGNDDVALCPKNSYSKISNIYFIPTISALQNWCERAKFREFELLCTAPTLAKEQRKTEWIYGESLGDFLDPNNPNLTIEGYPAPKRAYVRVKI